MEKAHFRWTSFWGSWHTQEPHNAQLVGKQHLLREWAFAIRKVSRHHVLGDFHQPVPDLEIRSESRAMTPEPVEFPQWDARHLSPGHRPQARQGQCGRRSQKFSPGNQIPPQAKLNPAPCTKFRR